MRRYETAVVNVPVCQMYDFPSRRSTVIDEVLYGMTVTVQDGPEDGWVCIRTQYGYNGVAAAEDLIFRPLPVYEWEQLPKKVVLHKNFCDVLSEPKVQGYHLQQLTRGGLVSPVGEAENGWQKVRLADGQTGYIPDGVLGEYYTEPLSDDEETLRRALTERVMLYQGTHYRWGGKSPMGIDCSGLCSMAYMLCGILIYRDARIVEKFPIHPIDPEKMKPGDLIFFPGHVAMYLGDGLYCHSTASTGNNGVTVNSLDPEHPLYRADLKEKITAVGSYF